MAWRKTNWHFVTSQGGEVTGGEVLNIGGTGGSFFLENKRSHSRIELVYGALGIGVGAGLPISISGATRDMSSGGLGYILKQKPYPLYKEEFEGFFVMGEVQYSDIFRGTSVSQVFFNIPTMEMLVGALTPIPVMGFARAMGWIWATSVGLEIGSVGAMYYYGYLSLAS